uniref:Uncharacterized protein n=1 Tax=Setaria viridis TaxID=4556 RepID=A0A4V6D873_SETVI|nr:hypothetical protein SEVIR_4G191601v2 [Setaria viridis]
MYDMVSFLLKLILLLPMAASSVLDDCLVTFIERDIFSQVNEDDMIKTFMSFKKRRVNKADK